MPSVKKLIAWVIAPPAEVPSQKTDRILLPLVRVAFLVVEFLRGNPVLVNNANAGGFKLLSSPSYAMRKALFLFLSRLGIASNGLVAIHSLFGYKYFCRLDRMDYVPGTEPIMKHFVPKAGDVVIDVGAHVGRYALLAGNRVGRSGKVIAIEADPETFGVLRRNVELNHLSNVIPINYAAYSTKCQMVLYQPGKKSGPTIYNTVVASRGGHSQGIAVTASTLDEILEEKHLGYKVDWMKIDVEGAEFDVLQGASRILSINSDIHLLVEIHKVSETSTHYREISELLRNYGLVSITEFTYSSGERQVIFARDTRSTLEVG